jgi:hypothetical protein
VFTVESFDITVEGLNIPGSPSLPCATHVMTERMQRQELTESATMRHEMDPQLQSPGSGLAT